MHSATGTDGLLDELAQPGVTALTGSGNGHAVPRLAATVALLRDTTDGVETYLMRRPVTMAFAPGTYVFPGGAVDPSDRDLSPGLLRHEEGAPAWRASALVGPALRELVAAAVRETFEETGVLLAEPLDGGPAPSANATWSRLRHQLLSRHRSFGSILQENGLLLDTRSLSPWARWVTPDHLPIRFDTYFFVASLPARQAPRRNSRESSYARWISPRLALVRHAQGRLTMMQPTRALLRTLAGYVSTEQVMRGLSWLDRPAADVLPGSRSGEGLDPVPVLPA
jgi:8-oxo-dGTP pyrophosphatase MutT (NUDIX family)